MLRMDRAGGHSAFVFLNQEVALFPHNILWDQPAAKLFTGLKTGTFVHNLQYKVVNAEVFQSHSASLSYAVQQVRCVSILPFLLSSAAPLCHKSHCSAGF